MFRLDADHAHVGAQRLDGGADPGDQAAAAHRRDDGFDRRRLLEDLQRHGALAGDDVEVVEGMQEYQIALRGELFRFHPRLGQIRAVQHHRRAERAAIGDLDQRREARHHHRHRDAEEAAVVGDAERMIAGRGRDHAALALLRREPRQRVARAALLEASGALQIVELAIDVRAGELRKRDRLDARRDVDAARDPLARGLDVGERKPGRSYHLASFSSQRPTMRSRPTPR